MAWTTGRSVKEPPWTTSSSERPGGEGAAEKANGNAHPVCSASGIKVSSGVTALSRRLVLPPYRLYSACWPRVCTPKSRSSRPGPTPPEDSLRGERDAKETARSAVSTFRQYSRPPVLSWLQTSMAAPSSIYVSNWWSDDNEGICSISLGTARVTHGVSARWTVRHARVSTPMAIHPERRVFGSNIKVSGSASGFRKWRRRACGCRASLCRGSFESGKQALGAGLVLLMSENWIRWPLRTGATRCSTRSAAGRMFDDHLRLLHPPKRDRYYCTAENLWLESTIDPKILPSPLDIFHLLYAEFDQRTRKKRTILFPVDLTHNIKKQLEQIREHAQELRSIFDHHSTKGPPKGRLRLEDAGRHILVCICIGMGRSQSETAREVFPERSEYDLERATESVRHEYRKIKEVLSRSERGKKLVKQLEKPQQSRTEPQRRKE